MGDGKSSLKAADATPASQPRALLSAVVVAINDLVAALDAVGLYQRLRESPGCRLRALDRNLPDETFDDLLVSCEAFAVMTGPSALATDDLNRLRSEAQRLLRTLQQVADAARGRRRLTLIGTTMGAGATGAQNSFLRTALSAPRSRESLEGLIDALSALAALAESGKPQQRKRLIPIGAGLVIPVTVLGGAMALIIVLLASIALVTGRAPITPNGLDIPLTSALPTATPLPTATARPKITPTANPGNPTPTTHPGVGPTPRPGSTPTTPPSGGYGVLSVSSSSNPIAPCSGNPDSFTISYSGGSKSLTWSVTSTDPSNLSYSQASGTLTPGGSVDVTVFNKSDTNQGTIYVTGGSQQQTVSFDATQCNSQG